MGCFFFTLFLLIISSFAFSTSHFIHSRRKTNSFSNSLNIQINASAPFSHVPRSSRLSNGRYVITWQGGSHPSQDVYARVYRSDWTELFVQFQVNTFLNDSQGSPDVAGLNDGNFVIVWMSWFQDHISGNFNSGIYGRLYDNDGKPISDEFLVNSWIDHDQMYPKVEKNGNGFTVIWISYNQDGNGNGVYAQMYYNNVTKRGGEFRVNEDGLYEQRYPDICSWDDGSFIIVYYSVTALTNIILARKYSPYGHPDGASFRINSNSTDVDGLDAIYPSVACFHDKSFAVGFILRPVFNDYTFYARKFSSKNIPLTDNIYIHYLKSSMNSFISPLLDAFVVVYTSSFTYQVSGKLIHPSGNEALSFNITEGIDSQHFNHDLISNGNDEFYTLWRNDFYPRNIYLLEYQALWSCNGVQWNNKEVCGGKGDCSYNGPSCNCFYPYGGDECEHVYCYKKEQGASDVCNGHGVCSFIERDTSSKCSCGKDFYGYECNERVSMAFYGKPKEISILYAAYKDDIVSLQGGDTSVVCNLHIHNMVDMRNPICTWHYAGNGVMSHKLTISHDIEDYESDTLKTISLISITNRSEIIELTIGKYVNYDWIVYVVSGVIVSVIVVIVLLFVVIIFVILFVILIKYKRVHDVTKDVKDVSTLKTLVDENKTEETEIENVKIKWKINKELFIIKYDDVELISLIGQGGSNSCVYKASYNGSNVAFKVFRINNFDSQEKYNEFEREIGVMSNLKHPYVIEYCSNGDLENYFGKEENKMNFDMSKRIDLCYKIACGFSYLHSQNIIHRDVKSENILLDNALNPKIMDFGIAKVIKKGDMKTRRVGTPYTMSPEVALGRDYTAKADVFSFSIVMWMIVHMEFRPYKESEIHNIELKVANSGLRPSFNDEIGLKKEVKEIIVKNWSNKEDERNTFQEIVSLLEKQL